MAEALERGKSNGREGGAYHCVRKNAERRVKVSKWGRNDREEEEEEEWMK